MAELGGIRYPIRTDYDGSGIERFIGDLGVARSAFRQFKDDLAQSGASGKDFAATERSIADGARLVKQSLTEQISALKQITAAATQAANAQKQVVAAGGVLPANTAATAKNTGAMAGNLKNASTQASLLNSTILKMLVFREVVRVIQTGVSAFKDFVGQGVEFNAELEKTSLGIAGLVASIATIKNAQGRTLEGAEKFAAAQAEARRQTQLLTQDALRTGFAVKQLAQNFETAVGPGLAAGLRLDEIRQLAVRVAQIAPAVSLQQNQLAQEIRSLTTGHIRSQTDRIATIFGITSEDITRAKAAGTLFEFLETKFKGFQSVAEELPNTFDGLIQRIKTMVELTSALSSQGLFEELKGSLKDLRDTLFTGGTVNPKVKETLKVIFDAVTNVVKVARDMAKSLTFDEVKGGAAGAAAAIEVIGGILLGIIQSGITLLTIIGDLAKTFGLNATSAKDLVGPILLALTTMKLLSASTGLLAKFLDASQGSVKELVGGLGKMLGTIGLIVVGATAAFNAFSKTKVTISDTVEAIKKSFVAAFTGKSVAEQLVEEIDTGAGPGLLEQGGRTAGARFVKGFRENLVIPIRNTIHEAFNSIPAQVQDALKLAGNIGVALATSSGKSGGGNTFEKDKRALNDAEKESIRLAEQKAVLTDIEALHLNEISALRERNVDKERIAVELAKQETENLSAQRDAAVADSEAKIRKIDQTKAAEEDQTAIEAQKKAILIESAAALDVIDAKIRSSQETEREAKITLQDKVNLRLRESELLRQQTDLIQQRADLEVQTARNKNSTLSQDEQRLVELQAEALILKQQKADNDANFATQQQILQLKIQANQLNPAEGQRQLTALEEQHKQSVAQTNAELVKTDEEIKGIDEKLHGSVGQGAFKGLIAGAKALPTEFQGAFDLIKGAVNDLASTISQVLIDAFDPNNDTSAQDRFKAFLRGLLVQIVNFFVQIALAKAILGATGKSDGGGSLGSIIGQIIGTAAAAQGGLIRSPGHYRRDVGSYADGGNVRPNWVDRRDTVAAWLQPGEFVMPVSSVRQYGLAMMDSLRRGAIAPAAVHAAAGIGGVHAAARPPTGRSLAGGGAVAAGIGGVSNNQPTPAFLVADDKAMEMMLNGGSTSFMRFLRENADQVDGILRRARPQTR